MKRNILTIVVIALCLINLALSAVIVFSIVPMANRTNDLITQVASVINLELEDPNADSIVGNVPVEDREELEAIGGEDAIQVNLKDNGDGKGIHVAMYNTVTLIVNKKADDYKKVLGLIESNSNYILETVSTTLTQLTINDLQEDVDRKELKSAIREKLNDYFDTNMICDISINNFKYQ